MKMLIMSIIFSLMFLISSTSFWSMWLGLEMYNFFFTPWLMEEEKYKKSSKIFFYFVIQVMASGMFLIGMSNPNSGFFYTLLLVSMLLKLGGFPLHSWVLVVVENMKWIKFSFFLTVSKIGPIVVLMMSNPMVSMIKYVLGGVITPILGLKSSSIRIMLAYSSIAYMSWIVTTICVSKSLLLFFVIIYWSIFICSCFFFKKLMMKSVKDFFRNSCSYLEMSVILSLMGFPPFLGFFPKLFTVKVLCMMSMIPEALILSTLSVIPFYFYLKMLMSMMMSFSFKNHSFLPLMTINKIIFFEVLLIMFSLEVLVYTCM
uniref:NADH-ubiquinone oxidoreductase chain 2 n=1 Tax=Colpocephalum griffoneae TaxID=2358484 RepID=A0A386B2D8_9NEOP|nr:NADH dehydrogenase subunit 2 [Colpocephalum griffoneae]AYC65902.1 NADH dehydrogenase subunit 2 [Colpocephalum griffoneae]